MGQWTKEAFRQLEDALEYDRQRRERQELEQRKAEAEAAAELLRKMQDGS